HWRAGQAAPPPQGATWLRGSACGRSAASRQEGLQTAVCHRENRRSVYACAVPSAPQAYAWFSPFPPRRAPPPAWPFARMYRDREEAQAAHGKCIQQMITYHRRKTPAAKPERGRSGQGSARENQPVEKLARRPEDTGRLDDTIAERRDHAHF